MIRRPRSDRHPPRPAAPPGDVGSTRWPGGRPGPDLGSGTVWLLAVGLVLWAAALAGVALGAAQVARHTAQSAADLGALAGAARAIDGPAAACARAAEIVAANGAQMRDCRLAGLDLLVVAEAAPAPVQWTGRVATATARAGPLRADISPGKLARLPTGQARPASTTVNAATAARLSSGWLPVPHLGDCTQEGHPASQSQLSINSRVADNHSRAAA